MSEPSRQLKRVASAILSNTGESMKSRDLAISPNPCNLHRLFAETGNSIREFLGLNADEWGI
jgi:hypothetical protein